MSNCPQNQVFYRNLHWKYPTITHGEGVYLYDTDGNRYIDSASGAAVSNIGHGRREIGKAMAEQAGKIEFVHGSRWNSEPLTRLAEKVSTITPDHLNKIYVTSIGSESIESAIKMARNYFLERDGKTMKYKVISRQPSYHGGTIGGMSVSGNLGLRQNYMNYLGEFAKHIPAPYCYRCPYGKKPENCGVPCAHRLDYVIGQEGEDYVAAFLTESVSGSSIPAACPPPEYFKVVRHICDAHDVLLICDEVMTGFGRTGKAFGCLHFELYPDLMTMGKGMAAGYLPLGGIAVKDSIYDVFNAGSGKFVHGHTYGHHALSCAVGCAVQDVYVRENLFENAARMGRYIAPRLEEMRKYPMVGDVRCFGLMIGLEFVEDQESKKPFEPSRKVAEAITVTGLSNGIVLYPGGGSVNGRYGDHVMIAPPLIISEEQIDDYIERLHKTLKEESEQLF
jgi:adenosylmethionine-8-amino-7-oxononanoate aminotransferase